MFDIGWSELVVIAVVAIIAIGPKDLPLALKTVGQWVARARGLARDFQNSIDDMIREAELDKVKKEMETAAGNLDVTKDIEASKQEMERALEMPSIEMDPLSPPASTPATEEAKPAEPALEEKPAETAKEETKPEERSPPQRAAGGQG